MGKCPTSLHKQHFLLFSSLHLPPTFFPSFIFSSPSLPVPLVLSFLQLSPSPSLQYLPLPFLILHFSFLPPYHSSKYLFCPFTISFSFPSYTYLILYLYLHYHLLLSSLPLLPIPPFIILDSFFSYHSLHKRMPPKKLAGGGVLGFTLFMRLP